MSAPPTSTDAPPVIGEINNTTSPSTNNNSFAVVDEKSPNPVTTTTSTSPAATAGDDHAAVTGEKKREYKEFGHDKEAVTKALVPLDTIQLKAEDLYDADKVNLETVEVKDVFTLLQCTEEGLTDEEAIRRTGIFGPNRLEVEEINPFLQFLGFMWNPLSWVMEGAALVAIVLANGPAGNAKPPDWQDFVGIVLLLLINASIGFYEERSAGNAVKALMASIAPKAQVKRNGVLRQIDSSELVPGDKISFKIGDVVPADVRLVEAISVSIDQAALTGESLPVDKKLGDQCYSSSTCKQGEALGIVIATGPNTFFGRAASLVANDDGSATGHLQHILAQIGLFCMVSIGIFIFLEIIILYGAPRFRYSYRHGLDNILVLLIGGIPIAMPTVLSVTLAVGATQLSSYKAVVTRITAIEELAGVTVLCSDKTGTLTTNKLTVDKELVKTYGTYTVQDVLLQAARCCRTEHQDAIDLCVVNSVEPGLARDGITLLDFKPFNPTDKRTEITYKVNATGQLKRATKGMTGSIIELCTRNKTEEQENRLEEDVEDFGRRGLRSLAVAFEDVEGDTKDGKGNGFELIGLLAIFDPPRSDTKATIDDAHALGVIVKMVTGDQLAIAKETGRRLGLGDHMYPAKVMKEGPPPGGKHMTLDEMIMDADGFAGVFPEHKYEIVKRIQALGHLVAMTGDGANDAPALARANVGIAVEGATDAARGAADIVLLEPGLSTIIHAIRGSRIIFQRMRNYAIYACSVTIRIVVGFALMAFIWKFDFPPFMILIIAILNDGTIMTLSVDRVLPSMTPDSWDLGEIFIYAIFYGLYQALSTIILFLIIMSSSFFQDKCNAEPYGNFGAEPNDPHLHSVIYLQVAILSQALIFVTRSHSFSFLERPSYALLGAFALAQLVASVIALAADWGFTDIEKISWRWFGIVWIWNIIWYLGQDPLKFAVRHFIIMPLRRRQLRKVRQDTGVPLTRTTSRATSIHESLYRNRVSFLQRAMGTVGLGQKTRINATELQRFSSIQANQTGAVLARNPSRTAV